jgi:hypothetical protein
MIPTTTSEVSKKIRFHEQTVQNLVIDTYNNTTLRQNVLREIGMKKPALMVYTNGSIVGK